MKLVTRKRVLILGGVVLVLVVWGRYLIYWYPPITGTVMDRETGEPLEGAVVATVYDIRVPGLAGSIAYRLDFKETVTDQEGRFRTPWMFAWRPWSLLAILEKSPTLVVFKPRYESFVTYNIFEEPRQPQLTLGSGRKCLVQLRKLRTKEEAVKSLGDLPLFQIPQKECPKLYRSASKEWIRLGYDGYPEAN
jgi:hypothetical protein